MTQNLLNTKKQRLEQVVKRTALYFSSLSSRVHLLKTLSATLGTSVYLKRDDELSCSISGSKLRKYSSLLPCLIQAHIGEVVLIGGAYSNNVLSLSQLLIENGIRPTLFLRKPGSKEVKGNLLFTQMLVDDENIHWIEREKWSAVSDIAADYAHRKNCEGIRTVVMPEGASIVETLPGALTLSLDILHNESELGIAFDHIFIDAGTGLQASALVLGHAWCESPSQLHVLLLAQKKEEFTDVLDEYQRDFEIFMKEKMERPSNYELIAPSVAASFGSVNHQVLSFIKGFARNEGVFLDPIYSAKLVLEASKIIQEQNLQGNILLIHSGGVMALAGFQEQLLSLN